jgi:Ca-activated chloride channel family protein
MTFVFPWWLLGGVAACLGLLWMWQRYDARQRLTLARFISPHLRASLTQSVSAGRRRAKRGLLLGAIALLFVALAGPQGGYHWEQVTRRGNDIIFAVDTSRSMLTPDVKPDRLTRAKLAIGDFVGQLDGDAVGLIAFAGEAFVQSPLTLDHGAFQESLDALDTHIIPRGGTNIGSAIQEAQSALRSRAGSDKILVLVTDGEDLEGNALAAATAAAQQDGLKIYTVGVGTAHGDLIALPTEQGGEYVKDTAGNLVRSRLDETALKAIASATGGLYAPLGAEGQGLESIYQQALAPLAKHDLASRQQKIYTQRYQWPLAAALVMLLASVLLGTRRRISRSNTNKASEPSGIQSVVPRAAALSALLLLAPLHEAHASTAGAAQAYAKGDFVAAERDYAAALQRDPKDPILQYNVGAAAYRAGQFSAANAAFTASLASGQSADTKRLTEQQNTYYNLGNTLYRTGQKTLQGSPQETIQTWSQAVKAYDSAMQLRAGDPDSTFNRDFVMHRLEQLKKQQSAQSQSQQKQSGSNAQQQQQKQQQAQNQTGKDAKHSQPQPGQQSQNGPSNQNPQPESGASPHDQPQASGQPKPSGQPEPQSGSLVGQRMPDRQRADGTAQPQELGAADTQHLPGQMSREEARELLDSVKDEQQRYPVAPVARGGTDSNLPDQTTKDW